MAETLPINFPLPSESSIASYSYTDIAEGTGVVEFYGVDTEDNGIKDYSLITNTIYANNVSTTGTVGSGANQKVLDIDFDVTFNMPKSLKGIVRGQIPWAAGDASNANFESATYAVMKVRKWNGSTETEIVANTKSIVLTIASLEFKGIVAMIEVPVTTRTNFKKGETLRITVEIWASTTGSNGTKVYLCHDPMGRTYTPATTSLKIHVPFVLDL